jgi:TolB-like protein/class 3 adenylate cyclase/Flp pilus assembly protein TadD
MPEEAAMADPHPERRLAAILAADVVGYSRLVEQDEAATLAALKSLRQQVIDPLLAEHHGRIVKLMGDGALVEFGSVVDAVACAVAVQRAVAEHQAEVTAERRIVFRIGVNLGDVVVEGEDLLGDGVNIAARLEQLCEPGGVLVSGTAFDHLKGKLDLALEPRGELRLKNIREPIRAYRVRMEPATVGKAAEAIRRASPMWRWVAAVSLALLVAAGLTVWLRPWRPTVEPASLERMAFALPDKPSLAVLPFRNVGGGPEQDYFADGLTDDLITDLSKVSGLFVIARASAFAFKGRDAKARDAAESLGVRYVVDGSVRRAGNAVRVNVQLIDAIKGGQLWGERYDGSLDDIFAVQDKLVRAIVDALALKLTKDEEQEIGRGQTGNVDAREAFQKGWEHVLRFTREDNALAIVDLRRAIELDPNYGRASAALGLALFRSCGWGWARPPGMNLSQTCELASRYLDEARRRPTSLAHVVAAHIDLKYGHADEAFTEAARALALDPNDPEASVAMAWVMVATGRPQAGLELVRAAMRLNPTYPSHYALVRGLALFASGALDEAARVLEEALARHPAATELAPPLAATYARLGRRKEARAMLLRWRPGASQEELDKVALAYPYVYRWSYGPKQLGSLIDGMIVAALPLDVTVASFADILRRGSSTFERARAAGMLARFGPQAADAVPALVGALDDPSPAVRSAAITALGRIGPKAKAAISALANVRDAELRPLANDAVKEIDGR